MGCQGIVNTAGPADSASRSTLWHMCETWERSADWNLLGETDDLPALVPCHRLTEGRKRLFADVVFDPLGIDTRGLRCHAE